MMGIGASVQPARTLALSPLWRGFWELRAANAALPPEPELRSALELLPGGVRQDRALGAAAMLVLFVLVAVAAAAAGGYLLVRSLRRRL